MVPQPLSLSMIPFTLQPWLYSCLFYFSYPSRRMPVLRVVLLACFFGECSLGLVCMSFCFLYDTHTCFHILGLLVVSVFILSRSLKFTLQRLRFDCSFLKSSQFSNVYFKMSSLCYVFSKKNTRSDFVVVNQNKTKNKNPFKVCRENCAT